MKTFLAKSLAVIACLHLVGGHWAALQVVAWSGMLKDSLGESSLPEALSKTFDGKHRCDRCDSITDGQQEENDQRSIHSESKTNAVLCDGTTLPLRNSRSFAFFDPVVGLWGHSRAPDPRPPWSV